MTTSLNQSFANGLEVVKKLSSKGVDLLGFVDEDKSLAEYYRQKELDGGFDLFAELNNPNNYVIMDDWIPRNKNTAELWLSSANKLIKQNSVMAYINDEEMDPHLQADLSFLRNAVDNSGFDPERDYTLTSFKPNSVICLGTGSGAHINKIVSEINPNLLTVIVDDWNQFSSSFFEVDWISIWNEYCLNPSKSIHIISPSDVFGIYSYIQSKLISALDHTFVCCLTSGDHTLQGYKDKIMENKVKRAIHYTGFVMDEYNMIYNSWKALCREPKKYRTPKYLTTKGLALVCGSGPSLDYSIEKIKELKEKGAFIIACASNYGTLRKAGIDVDLLCLLERGDFMIDQYKEIIQEFGSGNTKLLASTTTPSELFELFESTMVYFRPALTPVSLFAGSHHEVLTSEGPQTINTGVAIATTFGFRQICLMGVDLGTIDLENVRSSDAIGISPRNFDLSVKGNHVEQAYTNEMLLDGARILEAIASVNTDESFDLYNASNGIEIKGWKACLVDDLQCLYSVIDNQQKIDEFSKWWNSSPSHSSKDLIMRWQASRPRESIFAKSKSIVDILQSDLCFFPIKLKEVAEIASISKGTPAEQIFPRVARGQIVKLLAAIYRQKIIMIDHPNEWLIFEKEACQIVANRVIKIRDELFELCDILEELNT